MTDRELDAEVAESKFCRGCANWLPSSDFCKNRRSPDGRDWRCHSCKRVQTHRYTSSEKGRATRRAADLRSRSTSAAGKRLRRAAYAEANPLQVRAREHIGNAVRRGYMDRPSDDRNWHNRWEFHHPDHSRPYFGVWVRMTDHKAIHSGVMELPSCTDYAESVRSRLLADWGFV